MRFSSLRSLLVFKIFGKERNLSLSFAHIRINSLAWIKKQEKSNKVCWTIIITTWRMFVNFPFNNHPSGKFHFTHKFIMKSLSCHNYRYLVISRCFISAANKNSSTRCDKVGRWKRDFNRFLINYTFSFRAFLNSFSHS